ncbi:hypothetical protein DOTSEDRAFT_75942 [Dothistroma septosporum NZE10]|uniref:Uncharacterized protein n=1 Tax=Dothistroma septosporum (strain NZE10 / CBS 128990) TaxID=675120 RepID=N1PDT2_DOTSN|nr:hypothetical protein DOTSEDRAFT_75942 [Dothistroma septosporum NZE10]
MPTMADNGQLPPTTLRNANYIILTLVIFTQIMEYIKGSPFSERFSSLYTFGASYYCVHSSQHDLSNLELFVMEAMSVTTQITCLRAGSPWSVHLNYALAALALFVAATHTYRRRPAVREVR